MALFQVDEEQKLKKALNAGIKRGNLKIIGGVLAVLILIIVFTMVDFGNLFKGQLDLQSCGQATDPNYFTCVGEKAQNGSCKDVGDMAGFGIMMIELSKKNNVPAEQISPTVQLTETLITEYKKKSCNDGFLANYSSDELSNYKDFCLPGSFFAYKQSDSTGKVLNQCIALPKSPSAKFILKQTAPNYTEEQVSTALNLTEAALEKTYMEAKINVNDLAFLTELKTDANYKTLASTKAFIENMIIEKNLACKEGPAYIPDPAAPGQCILSCDNARSEISKSATSYYIALQQGKPAAEKTQYLKTVSDLIKQTQSKGCYAGKSDEVQKLCNSFNNYQYGLGLSAEENTLLPSVTADLKCCSIPGQTLESGSCAYKDLKFQEDLISSLALYKYALVQNSTDAEKLKAATRLKTTLDAYKAQFEALGLSKFTNAYMEGKEVAGTCADTLEILNSNKIPANDSGKALTDALTDSSKLLQCCPEPGYYKLVSDPTNGENPIYSCAVPTEEFKEFQLEQKECYESPQMSGKIGEVFVMATESIFETSEDFFETYTPPEIISCTDPNYQNLQACQGTPAPQKISCTQIFEAWKSDKSTYEGARNFCNTVISSSSSGGTEVTGNKVGDCKNDPENEGCKTKNVACPAAPPNPYWWFNIEKDVDVYCGEGSSETLNCSIFPDAPGCTFDCTAYPSAKACPQTASGSVTIIYPEYAYCSGFPNIPLCKSDKPAAIYCSEHQEIEDCQAKSSASEGTSTQTSVQVIKPLYDSLKAKNDQSLTTFLKAVQDLDTTTKNSCKLTSIDAQTSICTALRNTLSAAEYTPASYSENIKTSLNTLANETLRCCYYENDGNTDLEINFNTSSVSSGFVCSSKTVKAPTIKSQTIDKTTFNPTALEKLKITYTVDSGATVTVSIADITGTEVYKFDDANVAAQALTSHFWDGKANAGTNTGKIVNNGTYSYSLKAKNSAGESSASGGAFAVTGTVASDDDGPPPGIQMPPQVIPQPGVKCTDNDLADNSTKICISGEWVLCTEGGIYDGQKSTDKKLTCAGGKWIDLSNPPPPPPKEDDNDPPCVENNTMMEGKRICKGGEWITCVPSLEGKKSSDGQKECRNGIWQKAGVAPPGTTPPGGDQGSGNLKISKHSAFPVGFNPLVNETKITYTISAKAEVEIRILTQSGVTIVTLVDNKVLDKGEYFVWWDGTNNANGNGKVVDPATYQYKITAKDPNNGTVKDVKTGNINVVYIKSADFENGSSSAVTVPPVNNQAKATVAMQGATGGKTAGTGPGILIYALFPLGGYFISRYKKK